MHSFTGPADGLRHADEHDLIHAIQHGDQHAYEIIVKRHYASLAASAYRIAQSRAAAEDIVQDVLLRTWERRAELRIEASMAQYLFGAVRLHSLDWRRRNRRLETTGNVEATLPELPPSVNFGETTLALDDLRAALANAVHALPPRCREIFLLNREEGLTYAVIASRLGISPHTVHAQMGRALKAIHQALSDWNP